MKLAIVNSRACHGIDAPLVTVEAHISNGFPGLHIVGLPETVVKESKDRVRSALLNNGFEFPPKRMTVNLAPADLPKEGARFDLPIAIGILAASGQIPDEQLMQHELVGELALSGELRSVQGVLPMVLCARKSGKTLIIPAANNYEAALVKDSKVIIANHLLEVCAYLKGNQTLENCQYSSPKTINDYLDLSDIKGQGHAKRALEISAAGNHSMILIGPPGTGKTMLASRLPSVLPSLSEEQALEVAAIASVSGKGFNPESWCKIPFRSPHHSCSAIALTGGGRPPQPGEISLAHQGVLFLDELPEFNRNALESLREPIESGQITISRAAYQTIYPARFQLIAAMNPCPCGYAGSIADQCRCTSEQIQRYLSKLSGPFLDRIDLQVEVPKLMPEILSSTSCTEESSTQIKARVLAAHEIQFKRQEKYNALLSVKEIEQLCKVDNPSRKLLTQVMQKLNFSARVYHRILKVARTIADLAESNTISVEHISEALTYRCLDRSR